MKTPVFLAIMLFSVLNSSSQEINLPKAVETASKKSDFLKASRSKIDYSRYSLKEVQNSKFGKLSLKSVYTGGDEPVYAFAETMRQGKFSMASMGSINNPSSVENLELGVEAGVPLFTGFKISNYEKMSEAGLRASGYYYQRAEAGTGFKAAYRYLTVLLRKKLLEAADKRLESSQKELETAGKLKDNGMVLGSDYYAALAIYSGLRNYRSNWANDLKTDENELKIELDVPRGVPLEIKGELKEASYNLPPAEKLVEEALTGRADLKVYGEYKNIAGIKKSLEKNSILPEVDAFASFSGNTGSLDSMRTSGIYGIKLTMPIGEPAYFSRVSKSAAEEEEISGNLAQMKKDVEGEVRESYTACLSALESQVISRETMEKAAASLELFRPMYRQGKQSIMEVLRAEAALLQAEAGYYEAVYKAHLYYLKTMLAAEKFSKETVDSAAASLDAR